ncbi:sulfate/molybdate ABC transporter ATP-binding protein [Vreelandella populi]|uniref:Sulfate ABC transporter ATP-binding protein n=1 Tax=Vreelandella populi TaxID=2498858 RepID=A0A433L7E4_9GAMM|nr:TOBE-like domain-containing protein [Halomonas populi]RUR36073.1 sulfate ABC transporter ATP-binding protein [Halomonas populi]RUR43186.1 sulfate ABC transporter ATP-binding protein [Halomonas populi]RUR57632.1 sulfate ABC transporter ATP-binding protein [Halomonas populi]
MSIRLENIAKHFGNTQALEPVNLDICEGELVGLLGPSGSGKTTLLRIIAGLESADRTSQPSRIMFGERDVTQVHVRDRRIGFVFQHYALFRHMSVYDNVAFGLTVMPKKERPSNGEIRARVFRLLEMVKLEHLAKRYPAQLSGGQQQRVSLARALAVKPDVLLLDEPFGALDAKVRQDLRRWLRRLHSELNFTSVFVTHDQEEALELSDRVVVMSNGRIEQIDAPDTLYHSPKNRFVFEFLGDVNHLEGSVNNGVLTCGDAYLHVDLSNGPEELLLRPHEVRLAEQASDTCHLPVVVTAISPVGAEVRVELEADWLAKPWLATVRHADFERLAMKRGQRLFAHPRQWHRFEEEPQNTARQTRAA